MTRPRHQPSDVTSRCVCELPTASSSASGRGRSSFQQSDDVGATIRIGRQASRQVQRCLAFLRTGRVVSGRYVCTVVIPVVLITQIYSSCHHYITVSLYPLMWWAQVTVERERTQHSHATHHVRDIYTCPCIQECLHDIEVPMVSCPEERCLTPLQ